jgi:chitinase
MTLAATAADSDGTVTRVEFFNGTARLGEDTSAPYAIQWNVGAAGTYTLTARATDNGGATKTSSPVTVTVTKKR